MGGIGPSLMLVVNIFHTGDPEEEGLIQFFGLCIPFNIFHTLRFKVQGSKFKVQGGSKFKVQGGLRFAWVQSSRFMVSINNNLPNAIAYRY
jgi:hypothetical protein